MMAAFPQQDESQVTFANWMIKPFACLCRREHVVTHCHFASAE
jgi:hypothetical protein